MKVPAITGRHKGVSLFNNRLWDTSWVKRTVVGTNCELPRVGLCIVSDVHVCVCACARHWSSASNIARVSGLAWRLAVPCAVAGTTAALG